MGAVLHDEARVGGGDRLMAVFTTLALQNALTAEEQLLAGLPGLRETLAVSRVVAPTFKQWLSDQIAEEERHLNAGTREFPVRRERSRYGEFSGKGFTTADAIRSWALRHYQTRLQRDRRDFSRAEILRLVEQVALSDDFENRLKGWKVDLVKFRREAGQRPALDPSTNTLD